MHRRFTSLTFFKKKCKKRCEVDNDWAYHSKCSYSIFTRKGYLKTLLSFLYYLFFTVVLSLRYRIRLLGKKELKKDLDPKKGTLFLANHPAEIDPCIFLKLFWFPYQPRAVATEFLFHLPVIGYFLRFAGALAIPSFEFSTNSYKKKRIEKIYSKIFSHLERGGNLLIYPGGGLKHQGEEKIAGASGVHHILQNAKDVNIVLVRMTGLWGSSFSRAQIGSSPPMLPTLLHGFLVLLKNGIFFCPKRKVLVECVANPKDFPREKDRLTLNRYLEKYFNARGEEPLQLVSYAFWKQDLPKIHVPESAKIADLQEVPEGIRRQVVEEIATLTAKPIDSLNPEMDLARDLGLDSLDIAQITLMLKEQFGVVAVNTQDLKTIGSVMLFAARIQEPTKGEEKIEKGEWKEESFRPETCCSSAENLLELFFQTKKRFHKFAACADRSFGVLSYEQIYRAVIALSREIRKLPYARIGIMLPASAGVNILILATLLAGKVPVMINWTLGSRNLKSVVDKTALACTLSAWNFLDRLDNVELDGIDETILLLEDLKKRISFFDKIIVFFLSLLPEKLCLKILHPEKIRPEDPAVILFTSGTESTPKAVPLSHQNLLSNLKGAIEEVQFKKEDVLLGMLPPFHSFGFSVTGLLPLLVGVRVVYYPNPTDGRALANTIEQWKISLLCSAPTFLKTILRSSKNQQLNSLRIVVVGAEKNSSEISEKLYQLNPAVQLLEGYGITECSPILTLNPPLEKTQGVGKPLRGIELAIVHPETLKEVPLHKEGLILARGPSIFSGYLGQEKNPFVEVMGKTWYVTGDLGFLDERGYLTLSGRLKRFVKIGGEMVSLGLIEEELLLAAKRNHWPIDPLVPSLAICAEEKEGEKPRIVLFSTFSLEKNVANEELKNSGMSNLIRISKVQKLPFLPLLGSGKIDYQELAKKMES